MTFYFEANAESIKVVCFLYFVNLWNAMSTRPIAMKIAEWMLTIAAYR
jgi:hypothetical protein